uniref:B30.2/SPRY domain-containing protein n=1 Tax=Pelusios castaneus TaxID=367368 RepID=A0A8C8VFZ8_9SAUR
GALLQKRDFRHRPLRLATRPAGHPFSGVGGPPDTRHLVPISCLALSWATVWELSWAGDLKSRCRPQLPGVAQGTARLLFPGPATPLIPASPGLISAPNALILPPVTVTLDPDTAHPKLVLSEDGKRVRRGHTRQDLPNTPERFNSEPCVLGREGFTSGRHYWEVEVGDGPRWAVGVARESVRRKREVSYSPKGGIWAVRRWGDQFWALTSPVTLLPQSRVPSRIRVCLDCDRGQVTFFGAGDEAPIFTFPPGSPQLLWGQWSVSFPTCLCPSSTDREYPGRSL